MRGAYQTTRRELYLLYLFVRLGYARNSTVFPSSRLSFCYLYLPSNSFSSEVKGDDDDDGDEATELNFSVFDFAFLRMRCDDELG